METSTATGKVTDKITTICKEELTAMVERQAETAQCASLDVELASLQVEALELEGRNEDLRERTAAAARMTRFENDRLVILGKISTPESAKLASLTEELNRESAKLAERNREISARVQIIETVKSEALRRSAEQFKSDAIELIRTCETALAGILDETRDILNSLEARLGTPIYQPHELTADERSETWVTLSTLYRGRG